MSFSEEVEISKKCGICSADLSGNSITYCQKCLKFMCGECRNSHKIDSGCNFLTVEELYAVQQSNGSLSKFCEHHRKPLKLICFECNELICRECIQQNHSSHKYEFIILASMKAKKELLEELKPLREVEVSLTKATKCIQQREKELNTQLTSVTDNIEASFQKLHAELEESKQLLLQDVNRKMEGKLKTLRQQGKMVSDSSDEVHSLIVQTEHMTIIASEEDLISQEPKMKQKMQQVVQTYMKPIHPMEEVDIDVKMESAEILQQACRENIKMITIPVRLTADRIPSTTEINCAFKVHLKSQLNCRPAKCCAPIEVCCKTLHNDFLVYCVVENIAHGEYCIQHTPTYRGRHELNILCNGAPIHGSPFQIFVTIHPTKIQNPVKIWGRFDKPNGIAINSSGDVIVAEMKGDIIALNKDGQTINTLKRTEHRFQQLRSIAVDNEDSVFFGELASNCIYKANKEFDKIQVQSVTQLGEHGHRYIAIVGDEIMVCEKHNKGKITVYNKDLQYVRKILHESGNEFCALSSDCHGLIYTGTCGSPTVHVLSNEGKVTKTFQQEKSKLITPWSIFVFSSYVYVADTGTKSIVVLNTRGNYVASFGHNLCSVCVDQDGFIYTCNFIKGRIEVY